MNIKKNEKLNTYYFSISLGVDNITGKRKQTTRRGFKTKKEAQKAYNLLQLEYFEGNTKNTDIKVSFLELIELYFQERKKNTKTTTYNNERGHIKNHIIPYFENAQYNKLTRTDILVFQSNLQKKSLSHNTINKIMLSLKMIFDFAIQMNLADMNPTNNVKQLKVDKPTLQFWTPEDFKLFIDSVKSTESQEYVLFFTFAYLTGARLSELTACTWGDIDFTTQTWRISKAINYNRESKQYYIDSTKTKHSERSISLNDKLIQLFLEYRKLWNYDYIFSQDEYSLPISRRFTRIFEKHIKLSKVKKIRFHDLRHSHVALLIHMNEQDYVIKERLGHASIKITYDIYGHLFPTKQKELASRLDTII